MRRARSSGWEPPARTVHALYARADELDRRWVKSELAVDFRDRMLDAVLRYMRRSAIRGNELSLMHADSEVACRLLARFWMRNGRRDTARRRRMTFRIDEDLPCEHGPFERFHDEYLLGQLVEWLVLRGERREVARAFVLSSLGLDSETVARVISQISRRRTTSSLIRQWARRRFGLIRQLLRQCPELFSSEVHK